MLWPQKSGDSPGEHQRHILSLAVRRCSPPALCSNPPESSRGGVLAARHLPKVWIFFFPFICHSSVLCHYWCEQCNLHFQLMHAMTELSVARCEELIQVKNDALFHSWRVCLVTARAVHLLQRHSFCFYFMDFVGRRASLPTSQTVDANRKLLTFGNNESDLEDKPDWFGWSPKQLYW